MILDCLEDRNYADVSLSPKSRFVLNRAIMMAEAASRQSGHPEPGAWLMCGPRYTRTGIYDMVIMRSCDDPEDEQSMQKKIDKEMRHQRKYESPEGSVALVGYGPRSEDEAAIESVDEEPMDECTEYLGNDGGSLADFMQHLACELDAAVDYTNITHRIIYKALNACHLVDIKSDDSVWVTAKSVFVWKGCSGYFRVRGTLDIIKTVIATSDHLHRDIKPIALGSPMNLTKPLPLPPQPPPTMQGFVISPNMQSCNLVYHTNSVLSKK
ncbi:unnamed protein product [Clonostachys byssicola]|uniref:Uncharacterized protein n=1 Tax=Clonostachys byssicola TaxID=160290 RepID=A0A9N9Y014_9HYPO|nr:unnamed protein product [Clonostachys byssicola]